MKKHLKKALSHPLIAGSVIIFSGSLVANIFSFLFNLFMTRNLTLSEYGNFAALISLSTLISLPIGSLTPALVGMSAQLFAKKELIY